MKFNEAAVGKWQGQARWHDSDTGITNTVDNVMVITVEDGIFKNEWSDDNGEGVFEGPISLEWEASIAWINEDSTVVSVTYCNETDTGIMREYSWKGTQTSTGDPLETITQQVIFDDGSGPVGSTSSTRTLNLNIEAGTHYVWQWAHQSKVD